MSSTHDGSVERDDGGPMERQPSTDGGSESAGQGHWFAGRDVDVILFRVNRRSDTLFQPPLDVLEHMRVVLRTPRTVETGKRFKRQWRAGNKVFDSAAGTLTGMIGWARSAEALSTTWDEQTQSWIDSVVPENISAVAPFAFDSRRRYLGVLKHSSFTEQNIVEVFTSLLNAGERETGIPPATDWAVEPIGDEQEFYHWVDLTDRILAVDFVFRRPNPDAEEAFQELFERLDAHDAKQIYEKIVARDRRRGLRKDALRTEPTTRGFIAAAMSAFGYVVGTGIKAGKQVKWDQRRRAARGRLEHVATAWDSATDQVLDAVRRSERGGRDE